ncbi:MAG: hypothetical protein GY854_25445 [Deltaproteobacteria bacterium]|nr:hypothetical protein [Deltaproteobacteria bacterium]
MILKPNFRKLVVEIDGVGTRSQAEQWLVDQPESVRAVTSITDGGVIIQGPVVKPGAFVDDTAQLIGGIIIEPGCYVGPYAVLRLDENETLEPLVVGEESNIQDGAVVHSTTQRIGRRVIVAHQAIVHGAQVEDDVTIYIQAVVDGGGTVIGQGSFLHQGSYVGKGIRVPRGRYVEPGRKVLTQSEANELPSVPEDLIQIYHHVIELNRAHVSRHSKSRELS